MEGRGAVILLTRKNNYNCCRKSLEPASFAENLILEGPVMRVHPIAYAEVLSQLIIKVAVKTKGVSSPSDIDDGD